jgi:hypothetical protein
MRFGFAIPAYGENADGGRIRELLVAADELGLDSAWFPDHVALPDYAADMLPPPVLEPLAACAWGLGLTNRLRFGTDVLVAPYRHPLVVAAMTGTLGRLAVDRLILGVGIGYLRGEFDALGVGPMSPEHESQRSFSGFSAPAPRDSRWSRQRHRCRSGSAATARPPCSGRRCSATGGTRCGCPTGRTHWLVRGSSRHGRRPVSRRRSPSPTAAAPRRYFSRAHKGGRRPGLGLPGARSSVMPPSRGSTATTGPVSSVPPDQVIADLRLLEVAGVEHVTLRFGSTDIRDLERFVEEIRPAFA